MSCERHFLSFRWEHHDWVRRVTATESHLSRQSDMWGRQVQGEYVTCHAEYVCRDCGKTRDGGECGCDKARGDECAVRLNYLEAHVEPGPPVMR